MKPTWIEALRITLAVSTIFTTPAFAQTAKTPLDPLTVPKFVTPLDVPPIYAPTVTTDPTTGAVLRHEYTVDASQFTQQILPAGYPQTLVWGYGGVVFDTTPGAAAGATKYFQATPGATFEATRGVEARVQWINNLIDPATRAPFPHLFPVDPTLPWANPNNIPVPQAPFSPEPGYADANSPVPIVTHLHGGEVESASDGHPSAWFTPNGALTGPKFVKSIYTYANQQPAATLWYHDHTLGIARQNVYAGLAGYYLLRDPADTLAPQLPQGAFDIPLVIQDKLFFADGSLNFPSAGINPDLHPYWVPEFFGDTNVVNGKAWPNLNVERRQYRFRLLNASNARFYNLSLSNGQSFTQIGSDGGYLPRPSRTSRLMLSPGERADILVDFSRLAPGTTIVLRNNAAAPHPVGIAPNPLTVGQVMQFTVVPSTVVASTPLPRVTNILPILTPDAPTRVLTLVEAMGLLGPAMVTLNGQAWGAPVSEVPRVGSTELWEIVNMTIDTHPIHLHLVQAQLLNRQRVDVARYTVDWNAQNGGGALPLAQSTVPLSPQNYLVGRPRRADDGELAWKDTIQARPGEVTRLLIRFAPQSVATGASVPGSNLFSFLPSDGPGYVWHCHILDHEDNEMMRPLVVSP